jgi:GNAT superfamily N-acetyltransferase
MPKRTLSGPVSVRTAARDDLDVIAAIALATGQDEDWDAVFPGYLRHLMAHGTLLVAERDGTVTGYGGTLRIGAGRARTCMLTDLFVNPAVHGTGTGRALLGALFADEPRRMTFSSLHSHAVPLYTSCGMDAWWPLLYLTGDVRTLASPAGWSVTAADADRVGALERNWTGIDRTRDHRFWTTWPGGSGVIARLDGQEAAAGSVGGAGAEFGICHLALAESASAPPEVAIRRAVAARDAVLAVLSWLEPAGGRARVCLPAPHPATRDLLAAGWRVEEFDLHMASQFDLIDARRAVPSPALA